MLQKNYALGALVASMALVTGCSKPTDTSATATDTAAPVATKTKMVDLATTPLADVQEVVVDNGAEPESLDPHKVSGVPESNLIRQMLVGLVSTDADGKTIGGMAESWENKDFLVWTFKIRDAKWSNGDPVTAQDFVYSFQRSIDPATNSPYASYLDDARVLNAKDVMEGKIKPDQLGVRAIDDKTFEVTLSEPVPYFPDMLAHTAVKPVHKATVEKFGEKWTDPANIVVNGPYKVSEWAINDHITMVRNPAYYDDANTHINKVTFLGITEDVAAFNRFKANEIDVAPVPKEQFKQAQAELGEQIRVSPVLCASYYEMNVTKPPFDDVRVRRALSLAMDRETMATKVIGMGQTPAYQLSPPTINGNVVFHPDWEKLDRPARIAEAKKLLEEAGYSDTKPLTFKLLYNTSESHKQMALAAQSFWQEALPSIKVELENQEWKTFLDTKQSGKFELARAGWCGDYNEASTFLNTFKTGNSNNNSRYSSSAFDKLMLDTLQPTTTDAERTRLYIEAEKQLDADSPAILVYHNVGVRAVKPYVLNYSSKDPLSNYQVKDWAIAKH